MTTKLSLTELKKRLSSKTNAELIEEIGLLYKNFPNVKEYYQSILLGDDSAILDKYKEILRSEFLMRGNRFPKMRLSVARKAVTDFKKISSSRQSIADIMITYVETGVSCTNEFGDIDEPFYNSMESMYETALKYVVKEHLFSAFDDRLSAIVDDTSGIGWGFHDQLSYLYETYEAMVEKPQALFSV
ncbi:MAG: DUF6155 family protein [Methylobacter sp.]|uniref:DUF6155 family protein n=1 Tax=Methylobacter sp. TaxID=2051955 RepID=UPI0024875101|nr:DUF6155 family protein [Methylobacter sp.]MDI1358397.1 DUF6155 family protein [Methylobacter sp.]